MAFGSRATKDPNPTKKETRTITAVEVQRLQPRKGKIHKRITMTNTEILQEHLRENVTDLYFASLSPTIESPPEEIQATA